MGVLSNAYLDSRVFYPTSLHTLFSDGAPAVVLRRLRGRGCRGPDHVTVVSASRIEVKHETRHCQYYTLLIELPRFPNITTKMLGRFALFFSWTSVYTVIAATVCTTYV